MSKFDLIQSLLNPQTETIVEAPAEPVAPAQPAGERVEIEDVDVEGKPTLVDSSQHHATYEIPCYAAISYHHPSLDEPFQLGVNFKVRGNYSVEDDSFDYEYGSQRGTHGGKYAVFSDLEVTGVEFPQEDYNYELFKLPTDRKNHVANFISQYFNALSDEQLSKLINAESIRDALEAGNRNSREYDPDFD